MERASYENRMICIKGGFLELRASGTSDTLTVETGREQTLTVQDGGEHYEIPWYVANIDNRAGFRCSNVYCAAMQRTV
jgi:hypothetical protein